MSLLDATVAAIEQRDPHAIRALDRALAAWVLRHTGSDPLAAAAFALSVAEGQGHTCLDAGAGIAELGIAGCDAAQLAALQAQPWVGDESTAAAKPFVLTAHGLLYSRRQWRRETRLAAALHARAAAGLDPDPLQTTADLDALFAGSDAVAVAGQRHAVATALQGRLLVLAGGPGTGKTTTVLRLLVAVVRQHARLGLPARPLIQLAAPTGKAAQRLADALRDGAARLAAALPADPQWQHALAAAPVEQAYTLHRLLGYEPWQDRYRHSAQQPLPADVVVVDEASMVDLAQMSRLFDALRPHALVILLGDPEQLNSVAAGSVLRDVAAATAPALRARVAELTHVFRSSGALPEAWRAIRRGDAAALHAACVRDAAITRFDAGDPVRLQQCLLRWWQAPQRRQLLARLHARDVTPAQALQALRTSQLLCALRDGPFGAEAVNAWVDGFVRRQHAIEPHAQWYHGRPVLVTRNDAERGLYNGDLGIALTGPDGLQVWFDATDADGRPVPRALPPHALPVHEPAYALTVHKSQGSEYAHVAVLLPPDPNHRVLSRQLVYTAATRAKESLEIWANAAVLDAAIARSTRRQGGLAGRLEAGS